METPQLRRENAKVCNKTFNDVKQHNKRRFGKINTAVLYKNHFFSVVGCCKRGDNYHLRRINSDADDKSSLELTHVYGEYDIK